MKVNDPNLSALASTESSKLQQAQRTGSNARSQQALANSAGSGDDVHLSELVRSLRSLAAESPERQAHLEQIARTYAQGSYQVDAPATAAKIIEDAQRHT
jgi:flagellar biosynthesis anti-sigma factor FlgM